MIVTASSKGQIVLPAELRKKYGISTGSRLGVVDMAGSIYLVPLGDDPIRELDGMLAGIEGLSSEALIDERRRDRTAEDVS